MMVKNVWVMVVRNRVSQEWSVVPQTFESGPACEEHFSRAKLHEQHDAARWHDMGWSIRNFHGDCEPGCIIRINEKGATLVRSGMAGMIFEVANATDGFSGKIAHVLDLRYPRNDAVGGYQSWSIPRDGYEVIGFSDGAGK